AELAGGDLALAAGGRVAARAVPEVHVADEAERLERLEVAVHRGKVGRRHHAARGGGGRLGAQRRVGGEQRGQYDPAGGRQAQAAPAERAPGGGGGRRVH